jgi:heat shock protein HslJ
MKRSAVLFFSFLTLFISSCSIVKNTKTEASLSDATWELTYISGPKIAFEGLYPNKKPQIAFNTKTNHVTGTSSCNGYSTKYTSNGKTISFGEPGPTTMMFCEGGGEQAFLQMIKKVDNYSFDKDGKLNLNNGEVPIMRFKKIAK